MKKGCFATKDARGIWRLECLDARIGERPAPSKELDAPRARVPSAAVMAAARRAVREYFKNRFGV